MISGNPSMTDMPVNMLIGAARHNTVDMGMKVQFLPYKASVKKRTKKRLIGILYNSRL